MRRSIALFVTAALLMPAMGSARPRLEPEAQISKALEGRVAGKPVDCLTLHDVRSSRIIDRTAILYTVGSTIYVNRPRNGLTSLDSSDVMITDTHSSQLCSIDVIRMFDPVSRFTTGTVFLGEFVPYKRVKDAARD